MGTRTGGTSQEIMDERDEIADEDEPLWDTDVDVGPHGNGSLKHTIPSEFVEMADLTKDDQVNIEIYRDHYVVRKK